MRDPPRRGRLGSTVIASDIESALEAGQDALVADAAAAELKAGAGKAKGPCANCGAELVGPHCHVCGQVADTMRHPLWTLLADAMEGLFSLDGRFLKTVPPLLLRPGRVSATYLKGARARFVQPFRLYLFSAVVFLLAVSVVTGDWTSIEFDGFDAPSDPAERQAAIEELTRSIEELDADIAEFQADGLPTPPAMVGARSRLEAMSEELGERPPLPSVAPPGSGRPEGRADMKCQVRRAFLPEELGDCTPEPPPGGGSIELDGAENVLNWPIGTRRYIVHQADVVIDDPSRFLESVNRWLSRVLIGLFPVYALLLAIMNFWKRRLYYYDHLVVSLHFHAFLFLFVAGLIALSALLPIWLLIMAFLVWSNVYVYRVHRLVYGSGRFSAGLRTLLIDWFYFLVVMSVVPVVLAIGGFLTA